MASPVLAEQRRTKYSLHLLSAFSQSVLLSMLFVVFVMRVHCWLVFSWASTVSPVSAGLLLCQSAPSLYWCLGLFFPRCRTLHFSLDYGSSGLKLGHLVCQPFPQFRIIGRFAGDVLLMNVLLMTIPNDISLSINPWWSTWDGLSKNIFSEVPHSQIMKADPFYP